MKCSIYRFCSIDWLISRPKFIFCMTVVILQLLCNIILLISAF